MQDLLGSLLGRRAGHLPSEDHSWPAEEDIQRPGSVPEEVGAGTGHSEEWAQEAHLACAETKVRDQGHLVQWVVVEEPEIQAAKWTAVEVEKDPGMVLLMEGQGGPGWGGPYPNHSC